MQTHWTQRLLADDFVCLDTETTSLDPYTGGIRLVSLANTQGSGVIDLYHESFEWLRPFEKKLIICHNMAFDLKMLWKHNFRPTRLWCTMIADKMLGTGRYFQFSLEEVAERRLGVKLNKELQKSDWSAPTLTPAQYEYSLQDAQALVPIQMQQFAEMKEQYDRQKPENQQKTILKLFELEMDTLPIACHMEMVGLGMDLTVISELEHVLGKESAQELAKAQATLPAVPLPKSFYTKTGALTKKARELYPHGVRKPETRDDFIKAYQAIGVQLPTKKDKKTGAVSVSISAETYGKIEHPSAAHFEEHTKLKKLLTSYVYPILGRNGTSWVHPVTGRVHGNIHQVGTDTGRFTITDPALQTIPKRTETGRKLRQAIIASRGFCILKADYSQIEMRVMAQVSQDRNLIQVYRNGEDIYKKTASGIFGVAMESLTKDQRDNVGKPVTLGSQYGQTPSGLVIYLYKNTGIQYSKDECTKFWKGFFDTYPGIGAYHKSVEASVAARWEQDYYAYSLDGRYKIWPPKSIPRKTFESGFTKYYCNDIINYPIQSTVGGRMKEALRLLDKNGHLRKVYPLLQVHDELVFEVPVDFVDEYAKILSTIMIDVMKTVIDVVPIKVECSWGPSWGTKEGEFALEY